MPGFPVPTAGAYDAPAVVCKLNRKWISYLLGTVNFLNHPWIWSGTDEDIDDALQEVEKIKYALAVGNTVESIVGAVTQYAGNVLPENYLWCDGSHHLIADYPALAALLAPAFQVDGTHFKTPDMRSKFVLGSTDPDGDDIGTTGGEASVTLSLEELPAHSHDVTDPGHNHTQSAHTHTITDPGHNHTQDAHNHTQNAHNHTQDAHLHDMRHTHQFFGRINGLVPGTSNRTAMADTSGSNSTPSTQTQSANDTGSTTATNQAATATNNAATATNQAATATNNAATATNQAATTGISLANATPAISPSLTGITVDSVGLDAAHNNMPPYLVLPYIIRAK